MWRRRDRSFFRSLLHIYLLFIVTPFSVYLPRGPTLSQLRSKCAYTSNLMHTSSFSRLLLMYHLYGLDDSSFNSRSTFLLMLDMSAVDIHCNM